MSKHYSGTTTKITLKLGEDFFSVIKIKQPIYWHKVSLADFQFLVSIYLYLMSLIDSMQVSCFGSHWAYRKGFIKEQAIARISFRFHEIVHP